MAREIARKVISSFREPLAAAAEVADTDIGRVDVQQTVMPRNCLVLPVVGQLRCAVFRSPHDTGGAFVEDEGLPPERPLANRECDLGVHERVYFPSGRPLG